MNLLLKLPRKATPSESRLLPLAWAPITPQPRPSNTEPSPPMMKLQRAQSRRQLLHRRNFQDNTSPRCREATHLYPMSSKPLLVMWYDWMLETCVEPSGTLKLVWVSVWWMTTRWAAPFRGSLALAAAAPHSCLEMMVTENAV